MKISKRLEVISDFIEETDRLIDIGCDHAILDIFLCEKKLKDVCNKLNCINFFFHINITYYLC